MSKKFDDYAWDCSHAFWNENVIAYCDNEGMNAGEPCNEVDCPHYENDEVMIANRTMEIKEAIRESLKNTIGRQWTKEDTAEIGKVMAKNYEHFGDKDVKVTVDPEDSRKIIISFLMPMWFVEQMAENKGITTEQMVKDLGG